MSGALAEAVDETPFALAQTEQKMMRLHLALLDRRELDFGRPLAALVAQHLIRHRRAHPCSPARRRIPELA